jgi:hypothetical protein
MPSKQKYYSTKQVGKPLPKPKAILRGLATTAHNLLLGPTPPKSFAPNTARKKAKRKRKK